MFARKKIYHKDTKTQRGTKKCFLVLAAKPPKLKLILGVSLCLCVLVVKLLMTNPGHAATLPHEAEEGGQDA